VALSLFFSLFSEYQAEADNLSTELVGKSLVFRRHYFGEVVQS
jgi:hypothetical protein